jgi:hypothetical protein
MIAYFYSKELIKSKVKPNVYYLLQFSPLKLSSKQHQKGHMLL